MHYADAVILPGHQQTIIQTIIINYNRRSTIAHVLLYWVMIARSAEIITTNTILTIQMHTIALEIGSDVTKFFITNFKFSIFIFNI